MSMVNEVWMLGFRCLDMEEQVKSVFGFQGWLRLFDLVRSKIQCS